jgi:hypothetical protein
MNQYYIAYEVDLRCYPNYSFEIGDVDGDGKLEFVSLNQNGNRLRVVNLRGQTLFERKLANHGNWGTPLICMADINGDGCDEIIVPTLGDRFEAKILAFNSKGEGVKEFAFGTRCKDDYGIGVPLLAPFRYQKNGPPGVIAAVAGGDVVALDSSLKPRWKKSGFRNDFGHEFYFGDVDHDGFAEAAFCTLDHINGWPAGKDWNNGEFAVLDHDGSTLFRQRVDKYFSDTHFDDIAIADFRGTGQVEILLEKGLLINLEGEVVWDVSKQLDHGQWIAHTPNLQGKDRLIFISELWGAERKSAFFGSDGTRRMSIQNLPPSKLDKKKFPGWRILPTRCHFVRWAGEVEPELFLGEQAWNPTSHDCFTTTSFELKAFFLDLQGNLLGTLPFQDAQIEGYWYNGEVHSKVADVDGDGGEEIVFPRQNGQVMVIKRR